MSTNNYIAKLKLRLDQAIIQREHWKQLAENRNSIVVTEVCPESRSVEEYIIDADSVRASWRLIRGYREQIEALRAERDALSVELEVIKEQQPVAFYWQDIGYPEPRTHGPFFGWPSEAALRNVDGRAIPVPLYTSPQPSPDLRALVSADDVRDACANAVSVFAEEATADQCREVAEHMREVLLAQIAHRQAQRQT